MISKTELEELKKLKNLTQEVIEHSLDTHQAALDLRDKLGELLAENIEINAEKS